MSKFYDQKGLVKEPSRARRVSFSTPTLSAYGIELVLPNNDRDLYEITSATLLLFHDATAGTRFPVIEVREPDGTTPVMRFLASGTGGLAPNILTYLFSMEAGVGFAGLHGDTRMFSMPGFIVPLNYRVFVYDFAGISPTDLIVSSQWTARLITSV